MQINIEHRLTEVEGRSENNERRINDLEKRQDNLEELTVAVNGLAIREENVENTVKEIKDDVKTLTGKPAKRWDGVVDKAISALVGGVATYILIKLGLG